MNRAHIPVKDRVAILRRQDDHCAVCRKYLGQFLAWHLDHIKPLALGGTNEADNLQALCPPCHKRKTGGEDIPRIRKADRQRKALPRKEEDRKPGKIPARKNPWPPKGSRPFQSKRDAPRERHAPQLSHR